MSVMFGYAGGSSWQHVAQLASRVGLSALVLVLAGALTGLLLRRRHSGWARRQRDRLAASPPAVRLAARFPRTTTWAGRRLDPASGAGLPLTAAVAAGVGATWLFLGITQDVVAREELASLDPRVHAWLLDHRLGWLDQGMQVATWLGSNAVLVPLLLLTGFALWRVRRTWAPMVWIAVVYGGALLARAVVGDAVHRHRPPAGDWLAAASGWSYPSGHTLQATAAYGVLVVLLAPDRTPRGRALLAGGAALVVAVVAASRVYLGMHWLTDVLGSITLGVALLCWWWVAFRTR